MAKRRRKASTAPRMAGIVRQLRAPAPIIKVSAPRAAPVRRRRRSGRRRSSGLSIGGLGSMNGLLGNVLGGAVFGFAVKQGWVDKLPEIPVIGRTGAAAIALDYFSKHGGGVIAGRAAMAAGCIAGYQLGSEGHIHGFSTAGDATPEYDYSEEDYG